jgi:formate dehydrogenase maturation protein FdhE
MKPTKPPSVSFRRSAAEWPAEIVKQLLEEEAERRRRDRTQVRYCPACGRRPECLPDKGGRHVYTLRCDKCQAAFIVHVSA